MAPGIRSARERVVQTLWFEGLGLLLVTPVYAWVSGSRPGDSLLLMVVLSVVVSLWAALYNTVFDLAELRWAGRAASERPHGLRTLHAIGLEATAVAITWPIIKWMTGLGWWAALALDIGLTLVYMAYGYLFHWAFDRLRPVARGAGG